MTYFIFLNRLLFAKVTDFFYKVQTKGRVSRFLGLAKAF